MTEAPRVAYLDLDGKDLHADALHVFAVCDHEGGARIGAYLRVVPPTVSFTEPSLGRVKGGVQQFDS